MLLETFDLYQPQKISDALSALVSCKQKGLRYHLYSGGTDLIPTLKRQAKTTDVLISLSHINEMYGTKLSAKKMTIGALERLSAIEENPLIKEHFPILCKTANQIASPQIRNKGTIGGNILVDNRCVYYNQSEQNRLAHGSCYKSAGDICHMTPNVKKAPGVVVCHASFVSDLAPVLMVLNARLNIEGLKGARSVSIRDFYHSDGLKSNQLAQDEILVSIELSIETRGDLLYKKMRIRNVLDFPALGIALHLQKNNQGYAYEIGLTGIETQPLYFAFDQNNYASLSDMQQATIDQTTASVSPLNQDFLPPGYRKRMIGVLLEEAFVQWHQNH